LREGNRSQEPELNSIAYCVLREGNRSQEPELNSIAYCVLRIA